MEAVLVRSFTLFSIIILGNVLKKKGVFKKEDSGLLSKIIMRITLPAMLLTSSATFIFNGTTITLLLLGLFANPTLAFISRIYFRKYSKIEQGSAMFNCSGYNIGNMTIPFASAFFAGTAMSYVVMFDIGNAMSWLGLVYSSANNLVKGDGRKFSIKALAITLSKSLPFMTYIFIITLTLFKLRLPNTIISVAGTIGSANTFLVFFMIGLMLEIKYDKTQMEKVYKILAFRSVAFIILSLFVYFILPLPALAKTIAILCFASPIPSAATVFCTELGDESAVPALVNSIALIFGIITSSIVLLLFI